MLLVLEIAGGVFLGLLLYNGLVRYASDSNQPVSRALGGIIKFVVVAGLFTALVVACIAALLYLITHPENVAEHGPEIVVGALLLIGILLWCLAEGILKQVVRTICALLALIGIIYIFGAAAYVEMFDQPFLLAHRATIRLAMLVGVWGMVGTFGVCFLFVFGLALRNDWRANRAAWILARESKCDECGEHGLRFLKFDRTPETSSSDLHKNPIGICPRCSHEQRLNNLIPA